MAFVYFAENQNKYFFWNERILICLNVVGLNLSVIE